MVHVCVLHLKYMDVEFIFCFVRCSVVHFHQKLYKILHDFWDHLFGYHCLHFKDTAMNDIGFKQEHLISTLSWKQKYNNIFFVYSLFFCYHTNLYTDMKEVNRHDDFLRIYLLNIWSIFDPFLPLGTSAEGVMSLPPSVRPSVHFWFVCAITRQVFNLSSPNLHQLCILSTYRLLSKMGSIDLDLPGHSGL